LWVTDGTVANTHEITGIAGASTSGVLSSSVGPAFTVFNNEVLFAGANSAGHVGLWVTDGTAAHELTGIVGASTLGVLAVFDPTFTLSNGEVLFQGRDSADQIGLWVTDGTAAGTHEVTGISGASTSGVLAIDIVNLPVAVPNDFTADG